ncbi:LamG domain-containing protein [Phenylobacterium sp.]|uniref:LamG domain-containing protein n=1 Tax=Phenylobacterium sp. TaxID=1871053 RepID=UPI0025D0896A|nr:LamG domain-containing protein [Phenylobacterium sp.]
MGINKRLIGAGAIASSQFTPSEHFGVMLYEGTGGTNSVNGGKFGAGAFFDGSNGKIDIDRNVLVGNDWTISMWVRVASGTPYTNFRFFDSSYGDYAGKLRLGINTDGTVNVAQGNATSAETSFNSTGTINDNAWHNLSVTFDGTTARLYIDGSADGTGTPSNYSDSSGSARIGGGNTISGSNPFKPCRGKIDQVRIFQKELSSSEITTIYNETTLTVESLDPLSEDTTDTLQVLGDTSCLALYKFDNNEDDKSGNYNGTGTDIQYAAGRYDQSALFNGSSSVVTLPSALSDGSTTDATCISFWFYTGNEIDSSTTNNEIMTFSNSGSNPGKIALGSTTGNFGNETISVTSDVTDQYTYSQTNIPAGWNHVVVQWNSGNTKWDIYVNNVAHTTYTFGTNEQGKFALKFGQRSTFYYTGRLDQIRVFNKILSTSEITTLYQENALRASYRFEGSSSDDKRFADGSDSGVTYEFGVSFKPDFVWLKNRSQNYYAPRIFDSSRGATKRLQSSTNAAESAEATSLTSFDTGGFSVGSDAYVNYSGDNFVAWCLKANGGTTSSNGDGDITSTVQANTDAGFSIVTWTSTSTISDTIGHGLNGKPDAVLYKKYSDTGSWFIYTDVIDGSWDELVLNSSDAATDYSGTYATSTTFKSVTSSSGANWITYCFKSVSGFSKIGTYEGNGSTDGPIVETGFEPAFLMVKDADTASTNWRIVDNKRSIVNPRRKSLFPNLNIAEQDGSQHDVDFLSNGFQIRNATSGWNNDNSTHFYMAFAADPDTEAPTLAKSFSTVTYSGTGANQSIEGLGFKPGFVWLKGRSRAEDSGLFDTVRGPNLWLRSSTTAAENDFSGDYGVLSFDDDGFSIGTGSAINNSGDTFVGWSWAANDNEPTIFGGAAIAVYKFEDNANDVSGNYNGTENSITYSTGNFNKAAVFNGSSSYVNLPTLGISGAASVSVSAWINVDSLSSNQTIFQFGNESNKQRFGFAVDTNGSLYVEYYGRDVLTPTGVITTGTFFHVLVSYNGGAIETGSNTQIYVNGVAQTMSVSGSQTGSANLGDANYGIGYRRASSNQYFDGKIDQLRIYKGALDQVQVDELYAETASDNDDLSLGGPAEIIVSANANAGFSIVQYEGNSQDSQKIPHGLSAAPELIITKAMNFTAGWPTQASGYYGLRLNSTDHNDTANGNVFYKNTAPTATVFTVGGSDEVNDNYSYISYCFHSVSGYSKIGSYTGNGSTQSITGLGFQPDWVMIKGVSSGGSGGWYIFDSVRGVQDYLRANLNNAESTGASATLTSFDSDGFSLGNDGYLNGNTYTYIYAAFKIN